jgi:GNAT superfamily N-acetyltransferase
MTHTEAAARNLDSLRFLAYDVSTGQPTALRFLPLEPADAEELSGESRRESILRDIWLRAAETSGYAWKLQSVSGGRRVEGLLRLGSAAEGDRFLSGSLLESAPRNRLASPQRRLRGVGTVLVAALVLESIRQGAEGRVVVASRGPAVDFYLRVGFLRVPGSRTRLRLGSASAERVLRSVLMGLGG